MNENRVPEVIPDYCGKCKYWQRKNFIDRYSGRCSFYRTETSFSRQCQALKPDSFEQLVQPEKDLSNSPSKASIKPKKENVIKKNDDSRHQVKRTSRWAKIGLYWALAACLLFILILIPSNMDYFDNPIFIYWYSLPSIAILAALIFTIGGIIEIIIRRPNLTGWRCIIWSILIIFLYIGLISFTIIGFVKEAPLHVAVDMGFFGRVTYILERNPGLVNQRDYKGGTILYRALRNRNKGYRDRYIKMIELIIDKGADINAKLSSDAGPTPLQWAVWKNDKDLAELLIDNGANINAKYTDGRTVLWEASDNGHTEIVELLLDKGAEVKVKTIDNGETALYQASKNGHTKIVKLLLEKGADVNAMNRYYCITPLIGASSKGYTEIVKLLLGNGADVNAKDKDGITPLLQASDNGHTEVVKLLLEKGADVNAMNSYYRITPLIGASSKGYTEIVKLLLEKRAEVNAKDTNGRTPLLEALDNGHTEVAKLLLENGADVNAKDKNGRTALFEASHIDLVNLLRKRGVVVIYGRTALLETSHVEIVKLLLENGTDVNAKDKDGSTALLEASKNGHTKIVKLLLEKGADINAKDKNGRTALLEASRIDIANHLMKKGATIAYYGQADPFKTAHNDLIKLLLENGADVNAEDKDGSTPLLEASDNGHTEVVKLLLQKGADVNVQRNSNGTTALYQASKNGYMEIVKCLLKSSADVNAKVMEGGIELTALKIAQKKEHIEIVQLLEKAGAKK